MASRMLSLLAFGLLWPSLVAAQTVIEAQPLAPMPIITQTNYLEARVAKLKTLDRLNGTVDEIALPVGAQFSLGKLNVQLSACRYPEDNPSGEAFAFLTITDAATEIFSGWMVASAPALNALDHARYDVWVLRCSNA